MPKYEGYFAVKVFKGSSPAYQESFRRDRDTMRHLKHEHIAGIRDAGTLRIDKNEYPYVSTEWIEGRTIDEHARASKGSPGWILDLVRLFEQAAWALDYAHRRGICHADISCRNIMVQMGGTGIPEVQVIDFGMAVDAKGGVPLGGTRAFMAPEINAQLQGHATPPKMNNGNADWYRRADIFSLGVVMHCCIDGRLPFQKQEHLVQPGSDGLKAPSLRGTPGVSPSLAQVVGHCLQVDPKRRYPGTVNRGGEERRPMERVALDLRAIINGDFPEGYRPSIFEAVSYALTRQRRVFWTVLLIVALFAAALVAGVSLNQMSIARASLAREVLLEWRAQIGSYGTASEDPKWTERADRLLDRQFDVKSLFPSGEDRVEFALLLGRSALMRDRLPEAERYLTLAVDGAIDTFGANDPTTWSARFDLAQLRHRQGRSNEALEEHRLVLARRRKAVEGLATGEQPEAWIDLARSLGAMGTILLDRGDFAEAEKYLREAHRLLQDVSPEDLNKQNALAPTATAERVLALSNLVSIVQSRGSERGEELADLWNDLLGVVEVWDARTLRRMTVENNYGHYLATIGRDEEALSVLKDVYERLQTHVGADHEQTLRTLGNLAVVSDRLGRPEAETLYREALARKERRYSSAHPELLATLQPFATWLIDHGQAGSCVEMISSRLPSLDTPQASPAEVVLRGTLGAALIAEGRSGEAVAVLRTAVERWRRMGNPPPAPHGASVWSRLAHACLDAGDVAEAEKAIGQAELLAGQAFPENHPVSERIRELRRRIEQLRQSQGSR